MPKPIHPRGSGAWDWVRSRSSPARSLPDPALTARRSCGVAEIRPGDGCPLVRDHRRHSPIDAGFGELADSVTTIALGCSSWRCRFSRATAAYNASAGSLYYTTLPDLQQLDRGRRVWTATSRANLNTSDSLVIAAYRSKTCNGLTAFGGARTFYAIAIQEATTILTTYGRSGAANTRQNTSSSSATATPTTTTAICQKA
jgi:hypothetical protein